MKKRCIKKLSLHRTQISDLTQRASKGGIIPTQNTETLRETICFSMCFGAQFCQFFQTGFNCQD